MSYVVVVIAKLFFEKKKKSTKYLDPKKSGPEQGTSQHDFSHFLFQFFQTSRKKSRSLLKTDLFSRKISSHFAPKYENIFKAYNDGGIIQKSCLVP